MKIPNILRGWLNDQRRRLLDADKIEALESIGWKKDLDRQLNKGHGSLNRDAVVKAASASKGSVSKAAAMLSVSAATLHSFFRANQDIKNLFKIRRFNSKEEIIAAAKKNNGIATKTAKFLGVSHSSLLQRLRSDIEIANHFVLQWEAKIDWSEAAIEALAKRNSGDRRAAAAELGVSYSGLNQGLRKRGLSRFFENKKDWDIEHLIQACKLSNGDKDKAAELIGCSPAALYNLIYFHGDVLGRFFVTRKTIDIELLKKEMKKFNGNIELAAKRLGLNPASCLRALKRQDSSNI